MSHSPHFHERLASCRPSRYASGMQWITWMLAAGPLLLGTPPADAEEWVVSLLDGRQATGKIVAWQAKAGLQLMRPDDSALQIPTAEVDHLEAVRAAGPLPGNAWACILVDGSRLIGNVETSRTEDRVLFRGRACPFPEFPLDSVRGIVRPDVPLDEMGDRANEDSVSLESGDIVRGTIRKLDTAGVHLEDDAGDRTIPWVAIRGVRLAPSSAATIPTPIARVGLADGSVVHVSDFDWREGQVGLSLAAGGTLSVAPRRIIGVETQTARRVWLSDIAPREYRATGFLDKSWPLGVDRTASGEPLRLQGRCHRRGIGLHSACRATWTVPAGAARFRTLIGVDDSAGERADADVRILLDDRLEIEHRGLRADQKPRAVDLEVTGASSLTIEVGFGRHAHVQDRVDLLWAEWLLKPKRN